MNIIGTKIDQRDVHNGEDNTALYGPLFSTECQVAQFPPRHFAG